MDHFRIWADKKLKEENQGAIPNIFTRPYLFFVEQECIFPTLFSMHTVSDTPGSCRYMQRILKMAIVWNEVSCFMVFA